MSMNSLLGLPFSPFNPLSPFAPGGPFGPGIPTREIPVNNTNIHPFLSSHFQILWKPSQQIIRFSR